MDTVSSTSAVPPAPAAAAAAALVPPPPSVSAAAPAPAPKPKRKRPSAAASSSDKAPGPGKNWRKGLKGALGKKPLEYDAEGKPVAPVPSTSSPLKGGDESPSGALTPSGSGASKGSRAKKPKVLQTHSPAPENGTPAPSDAAAAAAAPKAAASMLKPALFARTGKPRQWSRVSKTYSNIAGYTVQLNVLAGDEPSPFQASLSSSGAPSQLFPQDSSHRPSPSPSVSAAS